MVEQRNVRRAHLNSNLSLIASIFTESRITIKREAVTEPSPKQHQSTRMARFDLALACAHEIGVEVVIWRWPDLLHNAAKVDIMVSLTPSVAARVPIEHVGVENEGQTRFFQEVSRMYEI
jgi:hypothetical protein